MPANITGLALIQSRMVAGIAHLRGYDLARPAGQATPSWPASSARTPINRWSRKQRSRRRRWRWPPHRSTTPTWTGSSSTEVASDLIGKVAGRRVAMTVGRRVPVVGGLVGHGRRRLRDLADRPLRRPRAAAPRPRGRPRSRSPVPETLGTLTHEGAQLVVADPAGGPPPWSSRPARPRRRRAPTWRAPGRGCATARPPSAAPGAGRRGRRRRRHRCPRASRSTARPARSTQS